MYFENDFLSIQLKSVESNVILELFDNRMDKNITQYTDCVSQNKNHTTLKR